MRAALILRGAASTIIKRHRWLPMAATLTSGLMLLMAVASRRGIFGELISALFLLFTSYVWGYSAHVFKRSLFPPLYHLQRRDYAQVWDALAASPEEAARAATGEEAEEEFQIPAAKCFNNLKELVSLAAADEILEIGCGVGRIGSAVAPHCRSWTGADISANMLAHASNRLRKIDNARLVLLHSVGLDEFQQNSFDVVYAMNIFAHLDAIDRWRYVQEAFRVLRPGGRLLFDNIDLESDEGWAMFERSAKLFLPFERPSYAGTFSTTGELLAYATRAGFANVQAHHRAPLVIVTGVKPGSVC